MDGKLSELLTKERVLKAYGKVRDETSTHEGTLVLVTEEYYESALKFLKECFIDSEPCHKSLELQWSKEMEVLWSGVLSQDLSLMLLDDKNRDVIGIRVIVTSKKGETFEAEKFKDEAMVKMFTFADYVDNESKFYERFGVEECVHFLGLAVSNHHRRQGFGFHLMDVGLRFAKYLDLNSICVLGEASSNYSKRIYEKLGFDVLYELPYKDYKVDGEVLFYNMGIHKSLKVYGKRIDNY